jgi:serine/threonine protein kinase
VEKINYFSQGRILTEMKEPTFQTLMEDILEREYPDSSRRDLIKETPPLSLKEKQQLALSHAKYIWEHSKGVEIVGFLNVKKVDIKELYSRGAPWAFVYKAKDGDKIVCVRIHNTEKIRRQGIELERFYTKAMESFRKLTSENYEIRCKHVVMLDKREMDGKIEEKFKDFPQFDKNDRLPYCVMEYVEAQPLEEVMRSLTFDQKIQCIIQVCDALDVYRQAELKHGDMGPHNILIATSQDGEVCVYVIDNDFARGQNASIVAGREPFVGPEALMSGLGDQSLQQYVIDKGIKVPEPDHREDLFRVAATLYYLLTGRHNPTTTWDYFKLAGRFKELQDEKDSTKHQAMIKECEAEWRELVELQEPLEAAVFKGMAVLPEDRYETIGDFKEALSAVFMDVLVKAKKALPAGDIDALKALLPELDQRAPFLQEMRKLSWEVRLALGRDAYNKKNFQEAKNFFDKVAKEASKQIGVNCLW